MNLSESDYTLVPNMNASHYDFELQTSLNIECMVTLMPSIEGCVTCMF